MSKCCPPNRPIMGPIVPFNFWTAFTPVIPDVYKEAISPQQQIHDMCCMLHKLVCYSDMLASELNIDKEKLQELSDMFDRFQESGFEDYYAEQIHAWVIENMPNIMEDAIKMVFFGITADGYFCAWIPDSWDEIWFDTGANYNTSDYGCLMILFDAEGTGDFRYISDFDMLKQMITEGDEALSERLNRTNERVDRTNERVDRTERTLTESDEALSERLNRTNERVDRTERTLTESDEALSERLNRTNERVDRTNERVDRTNERVDRTERTLYTDVSEGGE